VDDYETGRDLLDIYKEFIGKYEKVFPLEKTIMLIGDNDYQNRKDVLEYIKSLPTINGNDVFTYQYKNLFLFHGNIESAHWQELFGKYAGIVASKISDSLLPQMLANKIIKKFRIPEDFITLLGHIHYLGGVDSAIFCGTLNQERIIYPKEMSLGYVVINEHSSEINEDDISIVQL
ncbi:MAG: hypothetical protein ACP5MW_07015, partial [Thermoplasmata archaeon]